MIFLKNVINKKNFWYYLLGFISLIIIIFILLNYLNKLNIENENYKNKLEHRTIYVLEEFDTNNINKSLVEDIDANECIIYAKTYNDVAKITKILDEFNIEYTFMDINDENNNLYNIIIFFSVFLIIVLIILITIFIYQFNNDDSKTLYLLKVIGYNNMNIFSCYIIPFLLIFLVVLLFSIFTSSFISILLNKKINLIYLLLFSIMLLIYVLLLELIFMIIFNKKTQKNILTD